MRNAARALTAAALLATTALSPSCATWADDIDDHWSIRSTLPRAMRATTGYDASLESSYRDFAWEQKRDIELAGLRYFLNWNPLNPNQDEWARLHGPRPANSLFPNPWNFIHLEGFLIGWAVTGVPVPIPVDSLIGLFEEGGLNEFTNGLGKGVSWGGQKAGVNTEGLYDQDGNITPFVMTDRAR
ncbi:MAG: hypothetical protein AAFR54_17300 [Planctomycetota bacterium]